MDTSRTAEERIRELEDREAIRQLIARYGFVIDAKDRDGIRALFADDAAFRSKDGVMNARGADAIMEQFEGRFAALGMSNHFTHDRIIDFTGADTANGLVSSHAEVVRDGRTLLTALRYEDKYVRCQGRWLFAERLLSFAYYVPVEKHAATLPTEERILAYDQPLRADWP